MVEGVDHRVQERGLPLVVSSSHLSPFPHPSHPNHAPHHPLFPPSGLSCAPAAPPPNRHNLPIRPTEVLAEKEPAHQGPLAPLMRKGWRMRRRKEWRMRWMKEALLRWMLSWRLA